MNTLYAIDYKGFNLTWTGTIWVLRKNGHKIDSTNSYIAMVRHVDRLVKSIARNRV